MAPFLLAMSYPASKKTERQRLISANAHFDVPLIVMTIFRLLLALVFITYTLTAIYSWSVGITFGVAIFILIVFVFSKRVRRRMSSIETKFLNNLNERELRRSGRNNNLVSNLHLAFMNVGYACPFVGERLMDSGLRSRYGVSIASIQRGTHLLPVPSGDTRVFPGDVIGVIGTDEDIQALLPVVEAQADDSAPDNLRASDLKLKSVQLSDTSPLVGVSVADSQLSGRYSALLVSVMRDDKYFTPDADTVFRPHDVLWMVCNPTIIPSLK